MTSRLPPSAGNSYIHTASLSWQGKRNSNQDRVLIVVSGTDRDRAVAAVADGLGGMQAGDKAAEIAVRVLEESAGKLIDCMSVSFDEANDTLLDIYESANQNIRRYADSLGKAGHVGTTLTTLVVFQRHYLVANIGDSRCYLIDDSGVQQITQDHTLADVLRKQGSLNDQEYNSSPFRNQLTRSLGPAESCDADIFPGLHFGEIRRACTFLLCSDGFYSKLNNEDLNLLRTDPATLQDVLEKLTKEAIDRESSDNLSAVAVRCVPELPH